jgi:phospholipid transport system substrate-binding protein
LNPLEFEVMNRFLSRRTFSALALVAAGVFGFASAAQAADEAADAFIKRVSSDILDAIKADKSIRNGDINKIILLVDQRVMPNVNFLRMTASAVGRFWRQATPEQQKQLQTEFKTLLVRTYSGTRFKIYGKEFRLLNDDQVDAVVQDPRGLTRA